MEKVTEPATTLAQDEITTTAMAPAPKAEAVCFNDDPGDRARYEYDSDPHNTQW